MKLLQILILTLIPFFANSQCDSTHLSGTYVGATLTTDYVGISITSEIEYSFIVLSLQTNLNSVDPTFKGRMGFQVGDKLKFVVFMPIMNLSLKEFSYNTPPTVELRYRPVISKTPFLLAFGTEFYKGNAFPYLTVSTPFK